MTCRSVSITNMLVLLEDPADLDLAAYYYSKDSTLAVLKSTREKNLRL
jgi:hypothetical protein